MLAASWICTARVVGARRISHEHAWGGIAGAAYVLRPSLSPTEEDWQNGEEDGRWWLWDALLRPLRLIRKYGQGH